MTSPDVERVEDTDESEPEAYLLYDGECPFCCFYARKSGFETPDGRPLALVDANRAPDLIEELRKDGCGVDEGMVLVLDGRRYQGARGDDGARSDDGRDRLVRGAVQMVRLEPEARPRALPVVPKVAPRGALGEGEEGSRLRRVCRDRPPCLS